MSVTVVDKRNGKGILVKDIPAGQAFTGRISNYPNWLFVPNFNTIVSLNNVDTGSWEITNILDVEDYCPVDIEIVVLH